ncbi:MAG: four helix bundle protein [Sedimentisphaerales bacterium]|jgi:four helix bundle protein|nr:four helix bundle protein [Sedimentisphaerales bacterium]
MGKSIVKQKSYEFALQIIKLCTQLRSDRHYEISSQLLRSGTSIGANVEEALAGQSRKDFFAKMSIASKEARETNYWLRLIKDAGIVDGQEAGKLIGLSEELIKILTSIVKTGYDNRQQ